MPATFSELRDQMEEALQARDHDQWCRLFDFYRRGTALPEKDLHIPALQGQRVASAGSPSSRSWRSR